jgi:hypothetical protein
MRAWASFQRSALKKSQASCRARGDEDGSVMERTWFPLRLRMWNIFLDKTNLIGHLSQHFLTLFPESRARNGTRGRSATSRASAHGRRGLGRFCGQEPRTSLKSAHTRPARLSALATGPNRKETSGRWLFQGLSIQRKSLYEH